jgi:hypothetical protein
MASSKYPLHGSMLPARDLQGEPDDRSAIYEPVCRRNAIKPVESIEIVNPCV